MKHRDCQEVFSLLSQYLDRELPDDICQELDEHIAGCPPCVEFVNSLKKSLQLCRSCAEMEQPGPLPPADRERLFAAYQQALKTRRGEA